MSIVELIDTVQFVTLPDGQEMAQISKKDWDALVELLDELHWEDLLAGDRSQQLLEKMADEALAEIEAGQARPMAFTGEGEIEPA